MRESRQESPGSDNAVSATQHLVYVTGRWSRNLVIPALITSSNVSLFAGIVLVSTAFRSATPWTALTWLFLFVCVEGLLTSYWLNAPERRHVDRLAYRSAEFFVIAVIVRMYTWAISGDWPIFRLMPNYLSSPFDLFDDAFFLVALVLAFLIWQRTNSLGELFAQLNVDQAEAEYYSMPAGERETSNRPLPISRGPLVWRYFQQWVGGGIVLILCVALSTFDLAQIARQIRMGVVGRLMLNPEYPTVLLVYFISGLLLLSQARLAALDARWLIGGTTKHRQVDRSWYRFSLWLILLIGLVAAFLPLGSTLAISHIIGAIIQGALILFGLLTSLFFALLSLLIPGVSPNQAASEQAVEPAQTLPPAPAPPAASDGIAGLFFSSMFWAVAIFVTVAALTIFLRDRGVRINQEMLITVWRSAVAWLQVLWRGLSTRLVEASQMVRLPTRIRVRAKRPELATRWGLIRVNALSPREQLRYFYLSIVRRAGARGIKRRRSETPLEFAQDLKAGWPDDEEGVDALTDAFLKARYSRRSVMREEIGAVRQTWRRLKKAIRRTRKRQDDS